jgi:hypothetical protein
MNVSACIHEIVSAPVGTCPLIINASVLTQAVVNQGFVLPLFRTTKVVGFILPLENNEFFPVRE